MSIQSLISSMRDDPDGPDQEALLAAMVVTFAAVIPADTSVVGGVLQIDPVDSVSGSVCIGYIYQDGVFLYDATDETTAHDGISCIVLIGGRRYKVLGDIRVKAVEAVGFDSEPTPTAYGQAWIDLTGEVGNANDIIIHTSRGWVPQEPDYGPPIYVKTASTDYLAKSYVHWDADDGWVSGFGPSQYDDATIPPGAFIWDNRVQNQTTNSPPATWSKGVGYIIGSSASGDWSGHAGKLAVALADGVLADGDTFDIRVPYVGQAVRDIALGYNVEWNGTAWVSATGSIVGMATPVITQAAASTVLNSGSGYTYSEGTAPVKTLSNKYDPATITYAAKRAGTKTLVLTYSARIQLNDAGKVTAAVLRGSETTAIAWKLLEFASADPGTRDLTFYFDVPDDAIYIYTVTFFSGVAATVNTVSHRELNLREQVYG